MIVRIALIAALAACGGSPTQVQPAAPAPAVGQGDSRCEAVRGKVEQLYRAEAQAREPKRVDEAVADNTAMVIADCGQAPDRVAACIRGASSTQQLEATCLQPIDDEGSEGDRVAR